MKIRTSPRFIESELSIFRSRCIMIIKAPIKEITTPMACIAVIFSRNIRKDMTTISTGMIDCIRKAFSAMVHCSPIYSSVLNEAIPMAESSNSIGKFFRTVFQSRFKWGIAGQSTSSDAPVQRQKASATGGTSARTARPTMKLPDQKSTAKVSKRYGELKIFSFMFFFILKPTLTLFFLFCIYRIVLLMLDNHIQDRGLVPGPVFVPGV